MSEIPQVQLGFGNKVGTEMTMAELAVLFGVTPKTITKWTGLGMPCDGGRGRAYVFDSAACMKWKMEYEIGRIIKENIPEEDQIKVSLNEARRRKELAGALKAELELANELSQVANIDDLMENFTEALINVRAKLVSMSSRLSGILSHQDEEGVSKILDAEVADMLEEFSEYEHEYVGDDE